MKEKLDQIRQEALMRFREINSPDKLNEIRVDYLGK